MTDQIIMAQPAEQSRDRLRDLFSFLMQRSAGGMMKVMAEAGLSMPQMVALHLLRNCGPYTISALAGKLSLSLAATSHLVDRMVQQRLVERNEDAQDRRQKQVVISAAGLALLEQLVEARLAKIGPITAALPPELRAQLDQVLDQVLEVLRQEPL